MINVKTQNTNKSKTIIGVVLHEGTSNMTEELHVTEK